MEKTTKALNIYERVRKDFPMLERQITGKPLIYLDSAATTLKPQEVIDAVNTYYQKQNTNVHRAIHPLAEEATAAYESARSSIQKFLHAPSSKEVIFTKGTTEGLNLIARSYGETFLQDGDEILITEMEHHANIIPWHLLIERLKVRGIHVKLRYIPINNQGELDLGQSNEYFTHKTRIFSFTAASNMLGTINDAAALIGMAKKVGAITIIDGAQIVTHAPVDVQSLDCDFFVCSAHKMFGPTGVGVLYGKESLLEKMPPYLGGGDMIDQVSMLTSSYNELPYKFEAGTPPIAQVIGLGAAVKYIQSFSWSDIQAWEQSLLSYAQEQLTSLGQFQYYGTSSNKVSLMSFNLDGIHSQDVASIIGQEGLALRSGHHCTQPILKKLGVSTTMRMSMSCYNTYHDVDTLVEALKKTIKLFS